MDDELTDRNQNRRSVDSDLEAIKRSKAKVGEWQTNFTLTESKVNFVYWNLKIQFISFFSLHIQETKHHVVLVTHFS